MADSSDDVWEEFALDDTPAVPYAFDRADTPVVPAVRPRRAATNSDWPPAPPRPRRAIARRAGVYGVAVVEPQVTFKKRD